ncbi:MAG: hypothetical protein PGN12_02445 [Sphingomonas phyllosphaerae]
MEKDVNICGIAGARIGGVSRMDGIAPSSAAAMPRNSGAMKYAPRRQR